GERAPAQAKRGRTAFLFSGQGAQRPGMGTELYKTFPAYAEAFEQACSALDAHLNFSVKEAVLGSGGKELARTEVTQPALFACQVALCRLLDSLGASPDALAGHSVGEIAAAHLAGVLALPDAAALVAARGRLMGALPDGGAMAATRVSEEEATESLEPYPQLSVAAINGPASVVVSGERGELEEWAKKRKVHWLEVSHAFHSPLMEPMLEEFSELVHQLDFSSPQVPFAAEGDLTDPARWVAHVREPVHFAAAVSQLAEQGVTRFLEVGPDAALSPLVDECLPGAQALSVALLRRERDEVETFLGALAAAHEDGMAVEWQELLRPHRPRPAPLPVYPFQRQRYWLEPGHGQGDLGQAGLEATGHPLLGAAIHIAGGEERTVLAGRLSLRSHPWLGDHTVLGAVVLPGSAFVDLALHAGAVVGRPTLDDLILETPLVISEDGAVNVQVSVEPSSDGVRRPFAVYARPEGAGDDVAWTPHARGVLADFASEPSEAAPEWPPRDAEAVAVEAV
ncbi:MAG TPA: acyltransferase domain-containing protein, partial [Thermoanaerobaculia bacterium]|nr:acyltransferase domain-containing protein [Thermoanaerobaculia bacterium]